MVRISEDFVQDRVEELKEREEVEAVAVVGSYARDSRQDHNDLDLFVIIEEDWMKRKTEVVDDVPVEYFFGSMETAKEWLEGEEWWKNYHWYMNSDVRFDPNNCFDELKKQAKNVRQEKLDISETRLEEFSYSIWDMKQDLDTEDVAQKRYLLNKFFDDLIKIHYLLEEEPLVKVNYRVRHLKDFSGYMYKLSQDFLLASSTMKKQNKLEKMIEYVSKDLPDTAPEWETEDKKRADLPLIRKIQR